MPKISQFQHNPQNVLGDLATFLYKEVLLYCESDDISGLSNDTNAKAYDQFKKKNKIELVYNQGKNPAGFKKVSKNKEIYLDKNYADQDIQDKIIFTATQNKVFKSFFSHIRNAFAHNQIKIDGDYLQMYDKLSSSTNRATNKMTMIGHIKKETLKELIICLKSI